MKKKYRALNHEIWLLPVLPEGFLKKGSDLVSKGGIVVPTKNDNFNHTAMGTFEGYIIASAKETEFKKGQILKFGHLSYTSFNVYGLEFFIIKDCDPVAEITYLDSNFTPPNFKNLVYRGEKLNNDEFIVMEE